MKSNKGARRSDRIERTQKALVEALLELIVEKGYERTTVEDILRRADVGRTAFYDHFENKQDLLLRPMAEITWLRTSEDRLGGNSTALFDVTFLFAHIAEQRQLVNALRGSPAFDEAVGRLRTSLLETFGQLLQDRPTTNNVPCDVQFAAQALTGALVQLLLWWIESGMPETPAAMAQWFAQMSDRMVGVWG